MCKDVSDTSILCADLEAGCPINCTENAAQLDKRPGMSPNFELDEDVMLAVNLSFFLSFEVKTLIFLRSACRDFMRF